MIDVKTMLTKKWLIRWLGAAPCVNTLETAAEETHIYDTA